MLDILLWMTAALVAFFFSFRLLLMWLFPKRPRHRLSR
jgi:hypothetical protein